MAKTPTHDNNNVGLEADIEIPVQPEEQGGFRFIRNRLQRQGHFYIIVGGDQGDRQEVISECL